MRKIISTLLALTMIFSSAMTCFASTSDSTEMTIGDQKGVFKNGIFFVHEDTPGKRVLRAGDATWDCGGGRVYNAPQGLERVKGWSTCKNSKGTDLEHYTVCYYSTWPFKSVLAKGEKTYGTGKVYAYSEWVDTLDYAGTVATVNYGF